LYREQATVFVQNHLLFIADLSGPFVIEAMDDFVPPRQTMDDGDKISE
jgi:hypothetical protein